MTQLEGAVKDIRKHNRALLFCLGEYFMVNIESTDEDGFEVTFPGLDYPVSGLWVTLDFHDEEGVNSYSCKVVADPLERNGGLRLSKPSQLKRVVYRSSFRAPTDLTVQVKEQAHVRRYDAALINLSVGGALIRTRAAFEFESLIDLILNLPDEPNHTLTCEVAHISREAGGGSRDLTHYGLKFVQPEPSVVRSIENYVTRRMRELYL